MINRACTDQLDDAIDCFEEDWSTESRAEIRSLLGHFDLSDDYAALTELIRIDIELRYKQGISIQLEDYFDEFDDLLAQPHHVAQIAFEDYRSRAAYGHPVSYSRWRELPGVSNEIWYQELTQETVSPNRRTGLPAARNGVAHPPSAADAAFESALETIGFRLIHEIGRGTLSHVYLATQNDLADRYVVLKVVQKTLAEPQNMAMLQHTNIVPIYSYHRIGSRSVICMPYAGGVTLADFLSAEQRAAAAEGQGTESEGKLASRGGQSLIATVLNRVHDTVVSSASDERHLGTTPATSVPAADDEAVLKPLEQLSALDCNDLALWIFQRLAAALAHSHARGVLHGDLKPANVLIRNDGEPALLDFNLSQSLDRGQVQHIGGTLPYMAPESYRALMGQAVMPHMSSDIYGLGVMLFEFVTGRLPYAAPRTSAEVDLEPAIRWRREAPDWRPDDQVSPGLRSIINRCLEFEPDDRYGSAEQLQEDLDNERLNQPLSFTDESRRTRTKKWIRRHPRLVSGSSVAMLLMTVLIPIAVAAKVWRDRSHHAIVTSNVKAFAEESTEALSMMVADPTRHQESCIVAAMKPLEEFGLLDATREDEFESSWMTPQEKAEHRETAMRHVAQVAFTEIDRLRASSAGEISVQQRARLNRLVDAMLRIQGDQPSRACLFIQAEQARLAGDQEAHDSLSLQAEKADWLVNDTEAYLEAIRLFTLRKYPQASAILTTLADRGTVPSALRWTTLGRSQYREGRFEDAKLSFTQSIERAPRASRLWKLRGLCYYKTKEYARAADDFSQAIEIDPTFTSARADRGLCRAALDDVDGAIDDYNRALRHAPNNVHALILRRRALSRQGDHEAANRDYQRALAVVNPLPSSIVARAEMRFKLGHLDGALADYEQALQMDRGNPMLLQNIAKVLSKMDRLPEALEKLDQAIEAQPGREKPIIDRAVLRARFGQYDEAKQDLKAATKLPNAPVVLYQAACANALLPDENRKQVALGFLSKAILAGYGDDKFEQDDDLDSLREMDGYQSLVEVVDLGARRPRRKKNETSPSPETAP